MMEMRVMKVMSAEDQAKQHFKTTKTLSSLQDLADMMTRAALAAAARRDFRAHDIYMESYRRLLADLRSRSLPLALRECAEYEAMLRNRAKRESIGRLLA